MAAFNFSNSGIRVCVDSAQEGRISGRIFSRMLTETLSFVDAAQLLLHIDTLLDAQNYPQAFQRARVFGKERRIFRYAAKTPEDGQSAADVTAAKGEIATFTIQIITRRRSTWQGYVDWDDGQPRTSFSSDLEFLHMLDHKLVN